MNSLTPHIAAVHRRGYDEVGILCGVLMGEQLGLNGFAAAVPTDRLFFAIFPSMAVAESIDALSQRLHIDQDLRGTVIQRDRLHLTLVHVGDWVGLPPDVVKAATLAATGIKSASFELEFDSVSSFAVQQASKPCVLRMTHPCEPLFDFQRQLIRELGIAGVRAAQPTAYVPHVTVLYDRQIVPAQAIEPIRWRAEEFVLVHSLLGQTRYRRLGQWLLGAG